MAMATPFFAPHHKCNLLILSHYLDLSNPNSVQEFCLTEQAQRIFTQSSTRNQSLCDL